MSTRGKGTTKKRLRRGLVSCGRSRSKRHSATWRRCDVGIDRGDGAKRSPATTKCSLYRVYRLEQRDCNCGSIALSPR